MVEFHHRSKTIHVAFCFFSVCLAYAQTYDLPLLAVETHGATIANEPKVDATLYIMDKAGVNPLSDTAKSFKVPIGIEIRGQTSASFDQKGYGFEIRDADGKGLDTSILGLPSGDDWVLHGPFVDKSLIRNAVAQELFRNLGRYAPRTKFVELFLNAKYQGVYLLLEKIKRDKYRVNISKMSEKDTTGDDVTGGYIFRIDKSDNVQSEGFLSSDQLQYLFHYPKKADILPQQEAYLKNKINGFETLMQGNQWNDPTNGYSSFLDLDAAVDYVLHEEITKNSDAYFCSFYMFLEKQSKGGKIIFGPPWDFNLAFGQVDYNNNMAVDGWQVEQNLNAGSYKIPPWLKKIFQDQPFKDRMKSRWADLRSSVWHSKRIHAMVDSLSLILANGADRHFERWDILGKKTCVTLGGFGMSFCFNGYSEQTWELEVSHMEKWLMDRIAWMDQQFQFQEPLEPVSSIRSSTRGRDLSFQIVSNRFHIESREGGLLEFRNLRGGVIWSERIPPGVFDWPLPKELFEKVWVATLNGKAVSAPRILFQ